MRDYAMEGAFVPVQRMTDMAIARLNQLKTSSSCSESGCGYCAKQGHGRLRDVNVESAQCCPSLELLEAAWFLIPSPHDYDAAIGIRATL